LCEIGRARRRVSAGTRCARSSSGLRTGLMYRDFLRATSRRSSRATAGCGSTRAFVRLHAASETAMSHRTRMRLITRGIAALVVVLAAQPGQSQTQSPAAAAVAGAQSAGPPATLMYANRPIVVFRATVLGRTPAERAAAAVLF